MSTLILTRAAECGTKALCISLALGTAALISSFMMRTRKAPGVHSATNRPKLPLSGFDDPRAKCRLKRVQLEAHYPVSPLDYSVLRSNKILAVE